MSEAILVIDVQPAYSVAIGSGMLNELTKLLNTTNLPVLAMWVGDGFTDDDEYSVRDYLLENGVSEDRLAEMHFIMKDYGFFRPWMDQGVDFEVITKVYQAMMRAEKTCSECLDLTEVLTEDEIDTLPRYDKVHAPSFSVPAHHLTQYEHLQLCGGGRDECLAEIEIYLQAVGQDYSLINHLVY